MKRMASRDGCGVGTTTVLLAPLLLIVAVPLAVATGHDFFRFAGEAPTALGFCAPLAYVVLRMMLPRLLARGSAGERAQAPESTG